MSYVHLSPRRARAAVRAVVRALPVLALAACSASPLVCPPDTVPRDGQCVARSDAAGRADASPAPDDARADAPRASAPPDTSDAAPARDTCVAEPGVDLPDPDGRDTDCDGIDGTIARAVFVTPGAAAGGTGTQSDPFHRIADAVNAARGERRMVLVAAGEYRESVALAEGVVIAGGYDAHTWQRGAGATRFSSPCPVLFARGVTSPTLVTRLELAGEDAAMPGASCVAARLEDAGGVSLVDVRIRAGRGGDGAAGNAGMAGAARATNGALGTLGSGTAFEGEPLPVAGGRGGAGCTAGGAGGAGVSAGLAARGTDGAAGSPAVGSSAIAAGGAGAVGNAPGARGGDGRDGAPGSAGASSSVMACAFTPDGYDPSCANGGTGTPGGAGGSGGGGGGSGLVACTDDVRFFTGSGGGGGGGGGCPGSGGTGGAGGGASVALLVVRGRPRLERVRLETSGGGRGGVGGAGGAGSAGGLGGGGGYCIAGLTASCSCGTAPLANTGGRGGNGGRGGTGGAGGGGGGGPSVGLVRLGGATPEVIAPVFLLAPGGAGGATGDGVGPSGAPGRSTEQLVAD